MNCDGLHNTLPRDFKGLAEFQTEYFPFDLYRDEQ
jgi:hypothetical protein